MGQRIEDDRLWFRANPDRCWRIRAPQDGDFPPEIVARLKPIPEGQRRYVLVARFIEDQPLKASFCAPPPLDDTDEAGAELFLVPADNCDGIGGVDTGDMRLAKASTMHRAVETLADWVADHDATLPSCKDTAS